MSSDESAGVLRIDNLHHVESSGVADRDEMEEDAYEGTERDVLCFITTTRSTQLFTASTGDRS